MKTTQLYLSTLDNELVIQRVSIRGTLYWCAFMAALATLVVGSCRLKAQTLSQASKSEKVGSLGAKSHSVPQASYSTKAPRGNVERGRRLFINNGCYECHGTEAQGGGYTGPRLAPPVPPWSVLLAQVRHPAEEMPPYSGKVLSDRELFDIYAFLQSVPKPPAAKSIPILMPSR